MEHIVNFEDSDFEKECSDDFGDGRTVLHLMIAPEQGAAGAGAAVGEDGLGNAFE